MPTGATASVTQFELERLLHRARLRFPEPLEREFDRDFADRWLFTNRVALLVGATLIALFGVLDPLAAPQSFHAVWALRYGLCTLTPLLVVLVSFLPGYRRVMQPVTAAGVFIVGASFSLLPLLMHPSEPGYAVYIFGVPTVATFGYTAPRLRFGWATAAGWGMTLFSLSVGIDHNVGQHHAALAAFLVAEGILIGTNGIGMVAAYFIDSGLRRNYVQNLILEQERARSEALLLNILPAPIAERLKVGEDVVDSYDEVSVLFADIVDFTPFAAGRSPHEVVAFLNDAFSRFDRLAERHRLEKIKTIGDAYMVVSGIPVPASDDVDRIAAMALEMLEAIEELGAARRTPVRIRIGLNAGPVIAGVIGLQKFSYDLWGDTVNTASRMESHGEPGRIQVTQHVFDRLADRYRFEGPRTISIKGKGEMPTYFLLGRSPT